MFTCAYYEAMNNRIVRRYGALPAQQVRQLMRAGFISGAREENVTPASLDLSLSAEAYEIRGAVQPRPNETVRELLALIQIKPHALSEPLLKRHTYLVRLNEVLRLPRSVYGFCNPKSSTGRIDVHARIIANNTARYDTIPAGYTGDIWLILSPRSFSILTQEAATFTQLRLFNGESRFSDLELEIAMREYALLWHGEEDTPIAFEDRHVHDKDGTIVLSAAIRGETCGWVCIEPDLVLDVSKIGVYDPQLFFEPLRATDGSLALLKDRFYILSTRERVRIPPALASEMAPMDERSGDFRSHYAGFLDPGWGWGEKGEGRGRPFTLEVRPFEDLFVREGQPIAKIRFEHMLEEPDHTYDTRASHYRAQAGPQLAKHFAVR